MNLPVIKSTVEQSAQHDFTTKSLDDWKPRKTISTINATLPTLVVNKVLDPQTDFLTKRKLQSEKSIVSSDMRNNVKKDNHRHHILMNHSKKDVTARPTGYFANHAGKNESK